MEGITHLVGGQAIDIFLARHCDELVGSRRRLPMARTLINLLRLSATSELIVVFRDGYCLSILTDLTLVDHHRVSHNPMSGRRICLIQVTSLPLGCHKVILGAGSFVKFLYRTVVLLVFLLHGLC